MTTFPAPAFYQEKIRLLEAERQQAGRQSAFAEDAVDKPKPWLTILTPPNPYSKTGGRCIVIAKREYRSKWWTLECFCKRARKDGTCQTLDGVVPLLAHPERVRFEHVAG